ncbi:MAG TPA: HD domain-containing phosphohydrolase [Sulfuricella sp.]|nr:HD domain-containing phosphohydrolase [Sulfuricella sp.]
MQQNIHKTVFKRLLLGWLALSLLIGGIVFYLEMEKVDDFVLDLAVKESQPFTANFDPADPAQLMKLKRQSSELFRSHFVVVELYDAARQRILEVTDPNKEAIEDKLKQYKHAFPMDQSVYYDKFWIAQKVYMQVLLPLHGKNGKLTGYFEGVYEVDPGTVDSIRSDVIHTLILVLAAILLTTVMLYPVIISLNKGLMKLSTDLLKGNIELMEVLGSAIAKRDSDTNLHNYRVTIYAIRLAEALGLGQEQICNLITGAFLHDVGKIGISDNILLKPGKLTDEEFAVMRTHVLLGEDILGKSNWLQHAQDVVEFHHEKYDGSGYMKGLKGGDIPMNARIFAIVDVFDALTSKRPYKEPFGFEETMAILQRDRGRHFDPGLLDIFSGIAPGLFREIGQINEKAIEAMLNERVKKYFFNL